MSAVEKNKNIFLFFLRRKDGYVLKSELFRRYNDFILSQLRLHQQPEMHF